MYKAKSVFKGHGGIHYEAGQEITAEEYSKMDKYEKEFFEPAIEDTEEYDDPGKDPSEGVEVIQETDENADADNSSVDKDSEENSTEE